MSYTDPVDKNFEPLGEGSRAIFNCDTGYHLSGPGNSTCREGQWTGAIPKCEKGSCKCTGNQGYWKYSESKIVDGKLKLPYNHGSQYGEVCKAYDTASYKPDDPTTGWALQPWYANRLAMRLVGQFIPRNLTVYECTHDTNHAYCVGVTFLAIKASVLMFLEAQPLFYGQPHSTM